MTTNKPNPAAAERAAGEYTEAITRRVHEARVGDRLELRDLDAALTRAWTGAGYPIETASGLLDAGHDVRQRLGGLMRRIENSGAILSPTTIRRVLAPLASLQHLTDTALAAFDRRNELLAARTQLEQARVALAEGRAQLEAAVNAGDVDAVMALRGEVEVTLTAAAADAELVVADLEIAEAEAVARRPRERALEAQRATAAAERQLEEARTALAAADARVRQLHESSSREATNATDADARIASLVKARDELRRRAVHDRATRLRRLAGLPDAGTLHAAGALQ